VSRTIRELVEERSAEIVGRAAERAALLGTLEEGGQLVAFVHGIAGVGKSTLLEAFAGEARGLGATVVRIDCRSIEPTERGFLEGLGGAVGGAPTSAEEAAERLARLAERVVLVLDTYEVFRLLDSWMRQVFAPALRDNTRLVVAGREPPVASWHATPGWSKLVLSVRLGNLDDGEAEELLARSGLDAADASRVNRLARGHPLSLELAAAAVRARPDAELEDIALQAVLEELTELYLDGLDAATREAVDAAAVVRRVTLSLLEAMLPERAPQDVFERVRALPFVQLGHDGLVVHDTIRETVARALRGSDPVTHRRYRASAWRKLRNELPAVPPAELWRHTADMLYLIDQPVVREAFFPTTEHVFSVEGATSADASVIEAIVRRHEPAAAAEHLLSWWEQAPQGFSVVRDREGGVAGFTILFEPDRVSYGAIEADPVTRSWRDHLRRDPVPRGQRVLFSRRWMSAREGELPSGAQAAGWLDIKRVYMELRPELRRIYVTVRDLATYAPIVTPLGFVPLPEVVQLDGVTYHSAVLDFGPSSVDGWLAKLAARELLIEEDSILDPVERQLVLDGRRVDLTRLEFEVLNYLLQREGSVVERGALLRDVWGFTYVGSNVVEAVIRSLRKKLGTRAPMIETVRSLGYRLRLEGGECAERRSV
jgi:DNA-binding winged helix-turn-helix (wHTH) protein